MQFYKAITRIFTENKILQHIGLSIVIGFFLIAITFLGLRIYTMHGKTISTPDLHGLSIAEGSHKLADYDLQTVISDSVYQQGVKPGTIVAQNPPAGFQVKKDRKIHVTIKAYLPEKTTMPDVVGVSIRQAKAILETNGLYIGKIIYEPDMALNNVLQQEYKGKKISPGISLTKGSDITLRLGNGYHTNYTKTPNLQGLYLTQAKSEIPLHSLNLGTIHYDNSIQTYNDSINAVIYRQRPAQGKQVRMGTQLNLWLSNDNEKINTQSK